MAIRRTFDCLRLEVLPRFARAGAAGLDLDEDERRAVVDDEVELAEAGPVVAGEHLEAEPFEVLGRRALPPAGPRCAGRRSWAATLCGDH